MPDTATRPTLLVVDDTPENLTLLGELLRPHYRVRIASSGERALKAAHTEPRPDLILLDVMMPGMDGYDVLKRLRADAATADIPIIFVTALDADEDEEHGLQLGGADYVTKPVRPAILLARVRAQLDLKVYRDWLKDQNLALEREVERRMRENEAVKDVSLHALALLAEARDSETGNHLHRTRAYVDVLARALQRTGQYPELDDRQRRMITKAAPLHDIGKVGIPDDILRKPGKLTAAEYDIMKSHPAIGDEALHTAIDRVLDDAGWSTEGRLSTQVLEFLDIARQIVRGHHEKWDGSGYPAGLVGEAIPLPARLMALADVYDALTCRRVYKPPFAIEAVDRILREGRGTHFDPAVVDAYFTVHDEFLEIAHRYADQADATAPIL